MRAVKDRPDRHTKAGLAVVAPVPVLALGSIDGTAVGAMRLAIPTGGFKMSDATFLCREPFENLYDVHGISPRVCLFNLSQD